MGLFGKPRELRALELEITGLRVACGVHARMPAANQQHAAMAFPRDMNAAVDRAVRAGHAAPAHDLLNEALGDPPSEQGGLDYEGIVRGALDHVPG